MEILILSSKSKKENILKKHPNSYIIDVTSKGDKPYCELSPFFPIGDIPVPGMDGHFSMSVEGLWQGLKKFEGAEISIAHFEKSTSGLKRLSKWYGKVLGHLFEGRLLDYVEARRKIFLPAYRFVLEMKRSDLVAELRQLASERKLILLDTTTNKYINNIKTPLSHAAIIRAAILNDYSCLEYEEKEFKSIQTKMKI